MVVTSHGRAWVPHAVKFNNPCHTVDHQCCLILPHPRPENPTSEFLQESETYINNKYLPMESICIPGLNYSKLRRNVKVPSGKYKGLIIPQAVRCSKLELSGVILGSNDVERLLRLDLRLAIKQLLKMLELIFRNSYVKTIFLTTIIPRKSFYLSNLMPRLNELNTELLKRNSRGHLNIFPYKHSQPDYCIPIILVDVTHIFTNEVVLSDSSYCQISKDGINFQANISEQLLREFKNKITKYIQKRTFRPRHPKKKLLIQNPDL